MVYACVYCGKEVPDGCPHPNVFSCCGEIGHTELSEDVSPRADVNEGTDR